MRMFLLLQIGLWPSASVARQQIATAITVTTLDPILGMLHALMQEIIPLSLCVTAPSTSENLPIDPPS